MNEFNKMNFTEEQCEYLEKMLAENNTEALLSEIKNRTKPAVIDCIKAISMMSKKATEVYGDDYQLDDHPLVGVFDNATIVMLKNEAEKEIRTLVTGDRPLMFDKSLNIYRSNDEE